MDFRSRLDAHLDDASQLLALPLALDRLEKLETMLDEFGDVVDVDGFRSADERLRRYFAEPLSVRAYLPERGRAVDIGSGGGSPALPLAIVQPAVEWTLFESNERKALFLEQVAHELGLRNVSVRAERFGGDLPAADVVTVRGVKLSDAEAMRIACGLAPDGKLLWFSGEERLAAFDGGESVSTVGPMKTVAGGGSVLIVTCTR